MSGQIRTLKNRIRSVEGTKKITRAMEMVAAAKLRRFQDMMVKARPFTEGLENLVMKLMASETETTPGVGSPSETNVGAHGRAPLHHPFFSAKNIGGSDDPCGGEQREEKNVALVLMTSDTGLCGSFNTDLVLKAKEFLSNVGAHGRAPLLIGVGKFGINSMKRLDRSVSHTFTDLRASRVEEVLKELKAILEKIYLEGEVDAVYVIYSRFLTVTTYQPVLEKLLPLDVGAGFPRPVKNAACDQGAGTAPLQRESLDYIFEPSPELIFQKLIPLFYEAKTRMIFLESFVSEQIARMRAMHQATDNAKDMIDSLVLLRNKMRQAAITKEIIEIVSGSRALKIK